MKIIQVTPGNVDQYGLFCIKNKKNPGYHKKLDWFLAQYQNGLKLKIAFDGETPMGFIEYIPAECAWRPVEAKDCFFIHCLMVEKKKFRQQGVGKALINSCFDDAKSSGKKGVAVMTSGGSWLASNKIFIETGFEEVARKDRFELLLKTIKSKPTANFLNWEKPLADLKGWHIIYANQCPWHDKSVNDLKSYTDSIGIDLHLKTLEMADSRALMPSGYGTFALVHDGDLLADHYISLTRFKNILKQRI